MHNVLPSGVKEDDITIRDEQVFLFDCFRSHLYLTKQSMQEVQMNSRIMKAALEAAEYNQTLLTDRVSRGAFYFG